MGRHAFAILLMVLVVQGALAQTWTPFVSKEGRFSISMPGTPTPTTKNDSTPVGGIVEHMFTVTSGNETFVVNYQDLPELAVLFGGAGRIYNGARQGFLKDNNATQAGFEPVTAQNRKGFQLTSTSPAVGSDPALQSRVWFFLIGRRLYVVAATWPQSAPPTDADRFFGSFQITR